MAKKKGELDSPRYEYTPKERRFIKFYTSGETAFNGTQAAIRASYSKKTAPQIAYDLLKKDKIRHAVDREIMSGEEVALRISDIARSNVTDVLDGDLQLDPEKVRSNRIIKKIKINTLKTTVEVEGEEVDPEAPRTLTTESVMSYEIETHDPLRALEMMSKYHKLFTDKKEIDVTLTEFSFEFSRPNENDEPDAIDGEIIEPALLGPTGENTD